MQTRRSPRAFGPRDRVALALAGLVALVALAGCDAAGRTGGNGATPVPGELTACDLVPAEDVQAALGTSALTGRVTARTDNETFCGYTTADDTAIAVAGYQTSGGAAAFADQSAVRAVEIPGVADGAVIVDRRDLYVLKGDTLLGFSPYRTSDSDAEAKAIADRVIAVAVPRMP